MGGNSGSTFASAGVEMITFRAGIIRAQMSWVQPLFESFVHTPQHILITSFGVAEFAPVSRIIALKFRDEFFHQGQIVLVLLPQVLLAGNRHLIQPVFGSQAHGQA
jgi:hypothetical protein